MYLLKRSLSYYWPGRNPRLGNITRSQSHETNERILCFCFSWSCSPPIHFPCWMDSDCCSSVLSFSELVFSVSCSDHWRIPFWSGLCRLCRVAVPTYCFLLVCLGYAFTYDLPGYMKHIKRDGKGMIWWYMTNHDPFFHSGGIVDFLSGGVGKIK